MAEITATPHHPGIASSSTASCSASALTPYVHYDIFVNHFENETRDFAIALRTGLTHRGLRVFLNELDFSDQSGMEDAISLASLQIAIFSPNYAQWEWSMDTLVKMTKSDAPILPVFYKVEPFHLRFTSKDDKGPYAQSLRDHEEKERYGSQTIKAWRDALFHVSNLSGFQLWSDGGQEVLLGKVVDRVFKDYCRPRDYHVFLSHRGPDTKEKFAEPLYNLLRSHGLRVFLDKEEMVGALKIDAQIEVAIQFAHVNIVIFSPRFPESSWCMDELSLMTKIEGKILPVFYEVEPSHLDGVYMETLYCHHRERQREDRETIEKWKDALAKVPKSDEFMLAGEELKEELKEKLKEELMHKIVERVRKHIAEPAPSEVMRSSEEHRAAKSVLNDGSKRSEVVPVEDFYIGLPEKLEDFEKAVLSQQEEKRVEAKVVGILGGVGIGKTVLAKEICKRSNYKESSSLFNVRNSVARKYALKDLQSKIIKDLKHSPSKEIESVEEGKEILQQHLRSCQALVILDDVDHVDQLYALTPILHPKSLILVTSSNKDVFNKDVLNKLGIVNSSIYHLTGLNGEDSRKLLLSYAFNLRNLPHQLIYHLLGLNIKDFQNLLLSHNLDCPFPRYPSDYPHFESLVLEFVTACDGLPEALKELGESLRGKDRSGWEKQLNQLRHNCELLIQKKLNVCYDSLNEEEQQIFLDVACFFIGENRGRATRIFGMEGLEKLEKRCLLKVTSKIEMNEFLRNYGRNKANRLTPRWLWHQGTKQINDLLENSPSELAHFRGITMNGDPGDETEMPFCKQSGETETFSSSRNLKFLAAQGGYVEKILTRVGSADLLWLKWHKCTHSSLPPWISMEKLRVLEVDGSKLTELWQTESQVPLQLRELNICAPLSRFPQSIGQLKLLEKIVVKCSGPLPFTALPEEFCRPECSGMMSLPDSFGDLANLQYLDLTGASCLQMLPESFGNLTVLKYLSLEGCSEIRKLPGLEHFTSLETLDVRGCKNLESIPELGKLIKLQILDVSGCSQIKWLSGLEHLNSLEKFNVSGCQKLQSIPGLGQLTKLPELNVSGCSEIKSLRGLENLTSLESFNVSGCQKLESIPELGKLTKLQTLDVSGCSEIQKLPGLEHLTSLKTFNVRGCEKLQSIDVSGSRGIHTLSGLEHLTSLKKLNASGCKKLQRLSFGLLTKLMTIDVSGCCEIQSLLGLKHLTSLKTLNVSGCKKLQSIRGLGQLRKLQTLNVSRCYEIRELPGVELLTSLERLNISECKKLQSIRPLGQLRNIRALDVGGCQIQWLSGLKYLSSLKKLNIRKCEKLHRILGLGQLTKLQILNVSGCYEIRELPGVERLTSLKTLNVSECRNLESMPELAQLKKLQILDVGCKKLQRMPSLEHLTSLLTLDITESPSLERIPTLGSLTKLRNLKLCGLTSLRELPSLEHLTSLQSLLVCACQRLQSIPSLEHLTNVETLIVSRCGDINSLQGLEHLISLKNLSVCECKKLESMPGLGHLTKLETLDVIGCQHHFRRLKYPHFLQKLNIKNTYSCPSIRETEGGIQTLQGLERLISLKSLNVWDCNELESIPPLEHLISLKSLNVWDCKELESIPPLRFLQKLKSLHVRKCPKIQNLRGVEHLLSLESLKIEYCTKLEGIPLLRFLRKLKSLHLDYCEKIKDLPGVEQLISLESLVVCYCKELESIPPLRFLQKLKSLHLEGCYKIKDLPGVEHLLSLESLKVEYCKELESIPPLRFLQKLKSLHLQGCYKIKDLPGVEHLLSLESLNVEYCKELESIPPLRFLQKLKSLHLDGCYKIKDLSGVEHLLSLESLNVGFCRELESIPPLRFLQKLKSLHVEECPKIRDLPGVEHLISLESLEVECCQELESIPPLRFLQKLKSLHLKGCYKIKDLPGVEYAMSLELLLVDRCASVRLGRGVLEQLHQRGTHLAGDAFTHMDMHLEART